MLDRETSFKSRIRGSSGGVLGFEVLQDEMGCRELGGGSTAGVCADEEVAVAL